MVLNKFNKGFLSNVIIELMVYVFVVRWIKMFIGYVLVLLYLVIWLFV